MELRLLIAALIFWLVLLVQTSQSVQSHPEYTKLIQQSESSVFAIEASRVKDRSKTSDKPSSLDKYDEILKTDNNATEQTISKGTGFIISADGLLVTAAHVVNGAKKIRVYDHAGKAHRANLIKADVELDLALLQVHKLRAAVPPLRLQTTAPEAGQSILLISNQLGISLSASQGIVSNANTSLSKYDKAGYIQTDCVVNAGASGGPLINDLGEVIGIVTNIYSDHGGYSGVALARSSATAQRWLDR